MTLIFKAFLKVKVKFYDTKLFLHISHYFAFCSVAHFSVLDLSKINSKFCVSTWTLRKSFQHHTQCMTIFNSALYLLTFQTFFYGPVFAVIDIVPKNLAFDLKKGCENQGQCKNLDFVQIALVS